MQIYIFDNLETLLCMESGYPDAKLIFILQLEVIQTCYCAVISSHYSNF